MFRGGETGGGALHKPPMSLLGPASKLKHFRDSEEIAWEDEVKEGRKREMETDLDKEGCVRWVERPRQAGVGGITKVYSARSVGQGDG